MSDVLRQIMAERDKTSVEQKKIQARQRIRAAVEYVILLMAAIFVLFNYRWIINDLSALIAGYL